MEENTIVIGTSNKGKIAEIASILSPLGINFKPIALPIDETGKTIEENAIVKAIAYSKEHPNNYVIVEDSGLVVPAMNGLPGPYSARFHQVELDGFNVINVPKEDFTTDKKEHDELNNDRLIAMITEIQENQRVAYFEVCFAVAKNGEILHLSNGKSYGHIITEKKGTNGFGYDPIFVGSDTYGYTYAELDPARKSLKSHRKKALNDLGLWIANNINF